MEFDPDPMRNWKRFLVRRVSAPSSSPGNKRFYWLRLKNLLARREGKPEASYPPELSDPSSLHFSSELHLLQHPEVLLDPEDREP